MTDVKRHREFWLIDNNGTALVFEYSQPCSIHTIEISAVKELEEALNISKLEYEFLSVNDRHQHKLILYMRAEIEKLKNLLNKAVEALESQPRYDISVNPPVETHAFRKAQSALAEIKEGSK